MDAYDDVPLTSVVRTDRPVLGGVDDFGGRFSGMLEPARRGTRAIAALPLVGGGGPIGGLIVFYDEQQAFGPAQRRTLDAAARRSAEAVLRVRSAGRGAPVAAADLAEEGPLAATIVLDDDPRAAGAARRFLRRLLAEWDVGDSEDDARHTAELCLSELVTNAVVHAGTSSVLTVTLVDDLLTVAVRDHGGRTDPAPMVEDHDPLQVFGRGLALVDALAERWGCDRAPDGTTSWFALTIGSSRSARTD
jgi:anti-sigma regulatory factor (Ser/Thr protein kinase)